jgi:hypothetical protein
MEVRISQTDVKVIEELEEGGRGVANKSFAFSLDIHFFMFSFRFVDML